MKMDLLLVKFSYFNCFIYYFYMNEYKNSKKSVDFILNNFAENNSKDDSEKLKLLQYAFIGGKRLRPIISLEIFNSLNKNNEMTSCNDIILFIELLHSASLILDDLPCMDNDDFRRGIMTFHKKFGSNKAFMVSNFLIGKACSIIIKSFLLGGRENNFIRLVVRDIFNNNLSISIGQIVDLSYNDINIDFIDKVILKLSQNSYFYRFLNDFCKNNNLKIEIVLKQLVLLNMKTYPLFYLSFLLPFLVTNNVQIDDTDSLNKIEFLALSFSILFQICDDFEDFDKDNKTSKVDSHLKIMSRAHLICLYNRLKSAFMGLVIELLDVFPSTFSYFFKLLDKKIQFTKIADL